MLLTSEGDKTIETKTMVYVVSYVEIIIYQLKYNNEN